MGFSQSQPGFGKLPYKVVQKTEVLGQPRLINQEGRIMTLLNEKNLQKGEVVIYSPKLHWIVLIRPILYLFISVALLIITKSIVLSYSSVVNEVVNSIFGKVLIIDIMLLMLYLIWRIVEYCIVEYYITNKRLILKKGLFNSRLIDMPIEKVESLICSKGLLGYLLNYGTIFVSGIGGMLPRYSDIRKPYKVRRVIYDVMDKGKSITVTRENLPKPAFVKKAHEEREIQYGTFITSYPAGERDTLVK
ncbi:MAG: PH domain-containing protein [Treponema sp.]|jgi:hypothetical protein|nr:PH domain-containing protein [Treponema sp.]